MSVGVLHVGGARFPISGPLRFTMDSRGAVRAARALGPQTVIPIHYEGWSHFSEGPASVEAAFASARLPAQIRWLPLGQATAIEV